MFTDIQFLSLENVDSTNDYAKIKQLKPHANHVNAIIAREQTKGKGRFGKTWLSKKDESILMTLQFEDPQIAYPHQLTQILAFATFLFFKNLDLNTVIKWPNDIFVDDKKIGGILLEKQQDFYLLGIGLNINSTQEFLLAIDQKATSYFAETQRKLFVEEAAKVIAKLFLGHLNTLISSGFHPFYHMINEQALYVGDATLSDHDKLSFGKIIGIDKDGFLLFETHQGIQKIESGSLSLGHLKKPSQE